MAAIAGIFLKRTPFLLFVPLILIFHLILCVALLSWSGVLERALSNGFNRVTGLTCEIGGVRVELLKGIELRSISLSSRAGAPQWLYAPSALVCFTKASFPLPSNIVLMRPEITIPDREPATGRIDRDGALWEMLSEDGPFVSEGGYFPRVAVLDGILQVAPLALRATAVDARIGMDVSSNCLTWDATATMGGAKFESMGEIGPAVSGGSFRFRVEGQRIPCSDELESFLQKLHVLDVYQAFQPEGEFDLKVETDDIAFDDPFSCRLEIRPRDVGATFVGFRDPLTGKPEDGFPLPVSDIDGRIFMDLPEQVAVEGLRGMVGNGRVRVDGIVRLGKGYPDFDMVVNGREIDINSSAGSGDPFMLALEQSLPGTADTLEELRLNGRVDIVCTVKGRNDSGTELAIKAGLKNVEICPDQFPLSIENIAGDVLIDESSVFFPSLVGRLGQSEVKGCGRYDQEEGLSLLLSSEKLVLDDRLRSALSFSRSGGNAWLESLHLSKGVSAAVDYRNRDGKSPDLHVRLDLDGCTATSDRYPVAVEALRGRIEARMSPSGSWRFVVSNLCGSHEGSDLRANLVMEEDRLTQCEVVGRGQVITEGIRSLLSETAPPFHDFLEKVEIEGNTDFRLSRGEDGFLLELNPHLTSFSGPLLPLRFSSMEGVIRYDLGGDKVLLENVTVGLGQGWFAFDRGCVDIRDGFLLIALEGKAHGLPLAADLGEGMDPGAREIWGSLGSSGMINLKEIMLEARIVPGEEVQDVRGSLVIGLQDAAIASPFALSGMFGDSILDFQWPAPAATDCIVRGRLENVSFRLADRLFTNVSGRYSITDDSMIVEALDGRVCGGGIRLHRTNLVLGLESPWPFNGGLCLEDADLRMVLDRDAYSLKDIAGRLDVDVVFRGEVKNIDRLKGGGRAEVKRGSLWKLPVFSQLWEKISEVGILGTPPTFSKGQAEFTIAGDTIRFLDVEMVSTALALEGTGYLTLSEVDFDVIPTFAPEFVDSIPIIGPIVNFVTAPLRYLIKSNLARFTIRGPYENINVQYEPLLKKIFGREKVRELGRCPVPAPFDPGERF